jgi:O-methyltransferase
MGVKKAILGIMRKMVKNQKKLIIDDMIGLGRERKLDIHDYSDYVRISTLELAAYEIYDRKVTGNIAEIGVHKGDFAKYLNIAFPDRKIYLFDTFKGFDKSDMEFDKENDYTTEFGDFSKTSVDLVLSKMKNPENCIVKQGFFPETAKGLEDKFCFVSLDVDLYLPTYEGLKYFYPRLNPGGYIFIHDYVRGVKDAVRKYCEETKIGYVPLSDNFVSAIITK